MIRLLIKIATRTCYRLKLLLQLYQNLRVYLNTIGHIISEKLFVESRRDDRRSCQNLTISISSEELEGNERSNYHLPRVREKYRAIIACTGDGFNCL